MAGDSDGGPVVLEDQRTMRTATRRFQNISAILRLLNQAGLEMQTVSLSMYVGAACQHALRMTFVPEAEAKSFDTEVVPFWSQLMGMDATSPFVSPPASQGGHRGTTPRCSSMDSLEVSNPHSNEGHQLTRHRHSVRGHFHPAQPSAPSSKNPGSRGELTRLPPQATGRSPSHTRHPKISGQRHPTHHT